MGATAACSSLPAHLHCRYARRMHPQRAVLPLLLLLATGRRSGSWTRCARSRLVCQGATLMLLTRSLARSPGSFTGCLHPRVWMDPGRLTEREVAAPTHGQPRSGNLAEYRIPPHGVDFPASRTGATVLLPACHSLWAVPCVLPRERKTERERGGEGDTEEGEQKE